MTAHLPTLGTHGRLQRETSRPARPLIGAVARVRPSARLWPVTTRTTGQNAPPSAPARSRGSQSLNRSATSSTRLAASLVTNLARNVMRPWRFFWPPTPLPRPTGAVPARRNDVRSLRLLPVLVVHDRAVSCTSTPDTRRVAAMQRRASCTGMRWRVRRSNRASNRGTGSPQERAVRALPRRCAVDVGATTAWQKLAPVAVSPSLALTSKTSPTFSPPITTGER